MKTKISRRMLLVGGVAGLSLSGAALGAMPPLSGSREWLVQRVIYRYVPGITFDGKDLARFTAEVYELVLNRRQIGMRALLHYHTAVLLDEWPFASDLLERARSSADVHQRIIQAFFSATDFWSAPRTPGRRVAMMRSPDPYESRCSNPLAVIA